MPAVTIKNEIIEEFLRLTKIFEESFPNTDGGMSKAFYYAHGSYSEANITAAFKSYANLKKEAQNTDKITRKTITTSQNDAKKEFPRKYVVTCAIAGAVPNTAFLETLKYYCKVHKATLVILPMRGITSVDDEFHEDLVPYMSHFYEEYKFNDNLIAKAFMLHPQMILPLTGLARFGQSTASLIIAAPKHHMKCVPIGVKNIPHTLHTTGTVTMPEYTHLRPGEFGKLDHVFGALVVEVRDAKIFHIRHLTADAKGGFNDLNTYYLNNKKTVAPIEGVVLGDLHIGSEDPLAIKAWKEYIKLVKPKYVVLHDILDCLSINHHRKHDMHFRINLPAQLATLELELNLVAETLKMWTTEFPQIKFVITKGNHDSWLDNFLKTAEYARVEHYANHKIALELAQVMLAGKNPLQHFVECKIKTKNILWLDIDSNFKIGGIQCGAHGAIGNNGGKSSITSIELQFGKAVVGHTHSPEILRQTWIVGTSTHLDLNYNKGGGCSWVQASCGIYPNGVRQMITCINGAWKL